MFEIQEREGNEWTNYFRFTDPQLTLDTIAEAEDTLRLIRQCRGPLPLRIVKTEYHWQEF